MISSSIILVKWRIDMTYEKYIVNKININKCNFLSDIPQEKQILIFDILSSELMQDKENNRFPIIIDSSEIMKISIKIEQSLLKLPKGVIKMDITPSDEEKKCIDLRFNCQFEGLSKEKLISLKEQLFSIEKSKDYSNFIDVKKMLIESYLLHYLLIEAIEKNSNLKLPGIEKIVNYYQLFIAQDIDIERLLLEENPYIYNLDDLYVNLRNPIEKNLYIYFLKNGQNIIDFLLQEIINFFMFNQRNNYFLFNYFSSDSCTHTKCGDYHLENGHDVDFIKGYQKNHLVFYL